MSIQVLACLALVTVIAGSIALDGTMVGESDREPDRDQPGDHPDVTVSRSAAWDSSRSRCRPADFATRIEVPEASGATYVADNSYVLVVGDSSTRGRFIEIDPGTGHTLRTGNLPLNRQVSDDLEGLAFRDGIVYGITSSGWVRHWALDSSGTAATRYRLVEPAYPIARPGSRGGRGQTLVCDSPRDTNCARDYEGLCLRVGPVAAGQCIGFAASRADGALYCLVLRDSKLALDPSRVISALPPAVLAGCHFDGHDAVWLGANWFGNNRVFRVTDWQDPDRPAVEMFDALGTGFAEAIAVGPDRAIYRFSDVAAWTSPAARFFCE